MEALLKVLHINVRSDRGGAAGVARTIALGSTQSEITGELLPGYHPRAQMHFTADSALIGTGQAGLNLIRHRYLGVEARSLKDKQIQYLTNRLQAVDILHLHVVHSYVAPLIDIFKVADFLGKPIIWTQHDHWVVTGRCAQPGGCRGWLTGCNPCQDLSAYPPTKVDNASRQWVIKHKAITQAKRLTIVACADWLARDIENSLGRQVLTVQNGLDNDFMAALPPVAAPAPRSGTLFVCHDLQDARKVDAAFINRFATLSKEKVTVVGNNPFVMQADIDWHPATANRSELATHMSSHRTMIFTSRVDYFPMTLVEAACAGLTVIAFDSAAARELAKDAKICFAVNAKEAVRLAARTKPPSTTDVTAARNKFTSERMLADYAAIYRKAIAA